MQWGIHHLRQYHIKRYLLQDITKKELTTRIGMKNTFYEVEIDNVTLYIFKSYPPLTDRTSGWIEECIF